MMEEMDNRSIISNGSGMERSFSNGRYHQFHGKFMTDQNHNYSESEEKGSLSEEQGSTSSDLELREKLRQSENEKLSVIMDHNSMMRKCNERIDTHLREIQILEEHNKNLQTDLGEMRELCCYLDDDRKKCRQVATVHSDCDAKRSPRLFREIKKSRAKTNRLDEGERRAKRSLCLP